MNKWKLLLAILVALFVVYWIGHQGHVGLGSHVLARDSVSDVVMTLPPAVAQAAS